mmetsp:Transcript_24145/g.36222  ORF Transcript_24145/g.36222 Transcript_24145/m.36222 type:complete len:314 (-) Transcript_24145:56-997(-)
MTARYASSSSFLPRALGDLAASRRAHCFRSSHYSRRSISITTVTGAATTAALYFFTTIQLQTHYNYKAASFAALSSSTSFNMNNNDNNNSNDQELNDMWGSAIEGMIDVPGCEEHVLYLAPAAAVESTPATCSTEQITCHSNFQNYNWPEPFQKNRRVFCLTGRNPMGIDRPAAENSAANRMLAERLGSKAFMSNHPTPFAQWRSFGFHVQEGWREDGFAVSYNEEDIGAGRSQILSLAREFQQAAIYEFGIERNGESLSSSDASASVLLLKRRVVWCDEAKQKEIGDEECSMRALGSGEVPESELSRGVPVI